MLNLLASNIEVMKKSFIKVQDKEITILQVGDDTYVSLTDITKGEDGSDHIKNWMRNRIP